MPKFEVKLKDGRRFEVSAATPERAQELVSESLKPSGASEVLPQFGLGAAEGTIGIAGIRGDIREAIFAGARALAEKMGIDPQSSEAAISNLDNVAKFLPGLGGPTSGEIKGAVEDTFGEFAEPQTEAGKASRFAGTFVPGGAAGRGVNLLGRAARVAVPAASSEAGARVGKAIDPSLETAGRVTGAVVGGIGAGAGTKSVTSQRAADDVVESAKQTLDEFGVKSLTAGQRTGKDTIRRAEANFPGSAADKTAEKGLEEFTVSALKQAGIKSKRLTQDVVKKAAKDIGEVFDKLEDVGQVPLSPKSLTTIRSRLGKYLGDEPVPIPRLKALDGKVKAFLDKKNTIGALDGKAFQSLRSLLASEASRVGSNKPDAARALREIVAVLDDAMGAHLRKVAPDTLEEWNTARTQWRAFKVLERANTRAGQSAARGILTPEALRSAVRGVEGGQSLARGSSPLSRLAREGEAVLSQPQGPPPKKVLPDVFGNFGERARATRLGQGLKGPSALISGAQSGILGTSRQRTERPRPGPRRLTGGLSTVRKNR